MGASHEETTAAGLAKASEPPLLSVIILTRNEQENVEDAVRSVLASGRGRAEVIVVDSASQDGTVDVVRRLEAESPGLVRLHASPKDIPIGPARNVGIGLARGRAIAFLSADAMAADKWVDEMLEGLKTADVVYGRQEHVPSEMSVAAVVRGLRYHHFDRWQGRAAEEFASNVSAGMRAEVFERLGYVDDGPASALDDILFTKEACEMGLTVAFRPGMLARHKDATTVKGELKKNRREGYGWGLLAPRVGLQPLPFAWGSGILVALGLVVAEPALWTTALLLAVVYAPTLRRVALAGRGYLRRAPWPLAGASLIGPAFDVAFLAEYVRGLAARRSDLTGIRRPSGERSA